MKGRPSPGAFQVRLVTKDICPHVQIQTFWENGSKTIAKVLVDTGVEANLICGNPKIFKEQTVIISGLEGKESKSVQTSLYMKIGYLPKREHQVMIVPIPEYIIVKDILFFFFLFFYCSGFCHIGIDILKGLTLNLDDRKCQLGMHMIKLVAPVVVGKLLEPPVTLPETTEVVTQKQDCIPGRARRND